MENGKRIVWVDWLKVIACFMVMVVHSTEPFYLGGDGALIESESNAYWAAFFDSFVRSCVPLFVIASSFLLFPLHCSTGEFFKKRFTRLLLPFIIWSLFYALYFGDPLTNLRNLPFNFNYSAGHLWFVYMLVGLYLLMPMLSPWAEKVSRKELSIYIGIWFLSTFIPLARDWLSSGSPSIVFGPTGIPRQSLFPLWGEASWNGYGVLYYFSGYVGYMLVGLWLRKFGGGLKRSKMFAVAVPTFLGGFAITFLGFLRRVFQLSGGNFPVAGSMSEAVWCETTWCYDTTGVALMTIGVTLMMMNLRSDGKFYRSVITPVSKVSYGMYLGHMVALAFYSALFRGLIASTPLVIIATAVSSFLTSAVVAVVVRKIPVVGKWIIG